MDKQAESSGGSLLGFYNMFTGGALLKGAVFALGIMPYISASIIMQLAGALCRGLLVFNRKVMSVAKKLVNTPVT